MDDRETRDLQMTSHIGALRQTSLARFLHSYDRERPRPGEFCFFLFFSYWKAKSPESLAGKGGTAWIEVAMNHALRRLPQMAARLSIPPVIWSPNSSATTRVASRPPWRSLSYSQNRLGSQKEEIPKQSSPRGLAEHEQQAKTKQIEVKRPRYRVGSDTPTTGDSSEKIQAFTKGELREILTPPTYIAHSNLALVYQANCSRLLPACSS